MKYEFITQIYDCMWVSHHVDYSSYIMHAYTLIVCVCVCVNSVRFVLANRILKIFYTATAVLQPGEKHDLFRQGGFSPLVCLMLLL